MIRLLIFMGAFFIIGNAEASSKKMCNWERVTGIPEFDAKKHSDGCSGGMSLGYAILPDSAHNKFGKTLPWRQCCVVHDRAYYYGGPEDEKITADEKLKQCVTQTLDGKTPGKFLGRLMQLAVTPGGSPCLNSPWRWGYGEDYRK